MVMVREEVERLQENPVLVLSLNSKELFHSNLLGWLVERFPSAGASELQPWLVQDPSWMCCGCVGRSTSCDDERITRRLGQAGEVLDIDLLDHIVVGHQRWVSLARRGALVQRGAITDFRDDRSDAVSLGRIAGR
jgi:hypothetical protein